jgi:hypothetical protein
MSGLFMRVFQQFVSRIKDYQAVLVGDLSISNHLESSLFSMNKFICNKKIYSN